MKQNFTHIVCILDKSGSMAKGKSDVLGGFNTFIEEQKKVPGTATLTLVQFSDKVETTFSDIPLQYLEPLNEKTYICAGWTSLNDALGKTIDDVGRKLASLKEEERPSKVIVLVMTDGEENTSKLYRLESIKKAVVHQKEKYNWSFVFIGANIDAFATADKYGIGQAFAINYSQDLFGQQNAFKSVSRGVAGSRMMANVGGTLNNFFVNEKDSQFVSYDSLDVSDISETITKYTKDNLSSIVKNDDIKPTP